MEDGDIFKANYVLSDDDENCQTMLESLADSMVNSSAIMLKVNKGRKPGDSKIIKAVILEMTEPSE